MKRDSIWKRFEKSGSVLDYLEYACTCEEDVTGSANNMATNKVVMNCGTNANESASAGRIGELQGKADTSAVARTKM